MLPVDFWCMCEGHAEYKNSEYEFIRNTVFSALRWHAGTTAMVEKKDRRKIYGYKFPWEKPQNPKDQVLDYDNMKGLFNLISKPKDDG